MLISILLPIINRWTSQYFSMPSITISIFIIFAVYKLKKRLDKYILLTTLISLVTILNTQFEILNTMCIFDPKVIFEFTKTYQVTLYLPTLLLIILCDYLLSRKSLFFMVDQKLFMIPFRIKTGLCLILIPRLWYGDQSVILKSQIFKHYQMFFCATTALIFIIISMEALTNFLQKRYLLIIRSD